MPTHTIADNPQNYKKTASLVDIANNLSTHPENDKSTAGLDLLSISQTNSLKSVQNNENKPISDDKSNQSTYAQNFSICDNNAPYFAMVSKASTNGKMYSLWQGSCNDWTCARCGLMRAKAEYGRIVEGCRTLSKDHELYFVTLTCRGRKLSVAEADKNYLHWTNKLLTTWRTSSKRKNIHWAYVQVTERQKRGHPHSHIITTAKPHDLRLGTRVKWTTDNYGNRIKEDVEALRSDWFLKANTRVGLGKEYDISKVDSVEGTSRYVAKYLFKETMFSDVWAKNWRRVRYSQNFPKLEKSESENNVIPLVKQQDWLDFRSQVAIINCDETVNIEQVRKYLHADILIKQTSTAVID